MKHLLEMLWLEIRRVSRAARDYLWPARELERIDPLRLRGA